MDIPLFTSPFFRDSYCLYPFWNSSRSCLGCKKHTVLYSVTHRMRPSQKKSGKLFIWIWRSFARAVTYLSSDGAELSDRLLDKNKPYFFFLHFSYICMCVLWGMCCICMISFCVDESAVITLNEGYEWLYGPYLYHYHLYYPAHQCVITDILTAISVNVWPY